MSDPDLERWRAETPGVLNRIHFNNAGAGLMPAPVLAELEAHLRLEAEIGGYEAADLRAEAIDEGLTAVAGLVGAPRRSMAVVSSATAGFVAALSAFDFRPGDRIVTSRADYISNQIQYLALARRHGVEVVRANDLPEGGVDPDHVRALLDQGPCRLVAMTWIPTNSGLVQELEAVGRIADAAGVPYLVDACQAVGQLPISVEALRCDYLSATSRKFLRGPRGIGFLYVSDRALDRGDHPLHVDMRGAHWTRASEYRVVTDARRFQEWELPYALVLGMGAAARYAAAIGLERIQRLAWTRAEELRGRLAVLPGARVLDRGGTRCAIVTVAFRGHDPAVLSDRLRARRINANVSLREYAVIDFDEKGVAGAIRLSPHYYNSAEEVETVATALAELVDAG
jgi:selenocysteine lyase/cysteine desulfurase